MKNDSSLDGENCSRGASLPTVVKRFCSLPVWSLDGESRNDCREIACILGDVHSSVSHISPSSTLAPLRAAASTAAVTAALTAALTTELRFIAFFEELFFGLLRRE